MPMAQNRRPLLSAGQIGRVELTAVIFFTVSGGAYGLESLVGSLGARWALALIVLTPLVWSIPIAWMSAEMSAILPAEGGYYVWVREGLGDFWGWQEGWWTICYSAIDMALYPVLFVDYLAYFYPSWLALPFSGAAPVRVFAARWLVAAAVVLSAFVLNARGVRVVGRSATSTMVLVLVPFAALAALGLFHHGAEGALRTAFRPGLAGHHAWAFVALGLSTVMWNYSGWDNVSTFAAEVRNPSRSYPFALSLTHLIVVGAYVLPVLAGLAVTTSPRLWSESAGWPSIARAVAGPWLGVLIAAVAVVSAWSLFNSQVLYASRLPCALAADGWLPRFVGRRSSSRGAPLASLALVCGVAIALAAFTFTKLVVLDILLYAAEVVLEFLALIAFRIRRPELRREARIPGGWPGVILATLLPTALAGVVLAASLRAGGGGIDQAVILLLVVLSGVLIYFCRKRAVSERKLSAVRAAPTSMGSENAIVAD